jgi:hypothetical protein
VGRQLGRLGHQQVGGSSGRSDPLVGDGCEPGRWGPKGTHVSHYEKLVDSYATLEIAHEVVLSSIKFMQPLPHTCICSQAQIDLSCTNDCLSQASQSSIERVLIESYDDLITKENDELNKRLKGKGAKFFQFLIFSSKSPLVEKRGAFE